MTRELERALRATFAERGDEVPPQRPELADLALSGARAIRRRRMVAGSASVLAAVVLIGLGVVTAGFGLVVPDGQGPQNTSALPFSTEEPVHDDELDLAVNKPADGGSPYLLAGDGTKTELPKGSHIKQATRVKDGFVTVLADESGTVDAAYYPLEGEPVTYATGVDAAVAVEPGGKRVAVVRMTGDEPASLEVYGTTDGRRLRQRPIASTPPEAAGAGEKLFFGIELVGWNADQVLYSSKGSLFAWLPDRDMLMQSPPELGMRWMGRVAGDDRAYVSYVSGSDLCVGIADPYTNFALTNHFCYGQSAAVSDFSVSPGGSWTVGQADFGGGAVATRFDLTSDFGEVGIAGGGSMVTLAGVGMDVWYWLDDNTLLFSSGRMWFRMSMADQIVSELVFPAEGELFPVPDLSRSGLAPPSPSASPPS